MSTGEFGEAIPYFEEAERLDSNRQCHAEIFDASYNGFAKEQVTVEQLCDAADRILAIETDGRELLSLGAIMVYLTEEGRVPARCGPYVREAMERTTETENAEELSVRRQLEPAYTLYVSDDPDLALKQKMAGLPSNWESNAAQLNNLAWWCAVHGIHLERAEGWVREAVELATEAGGQVRASLLDTWAEVAWNRGHRDHAVSLLEQALEMDPENAKLTDRLATYRSRMGEG
jgi:tetratricopeptide (TPR) repeat protein